MKGYWNGRVCLFGWRLTLRLTTPARNRREDEAVRHIRVSVTAPSSEAIAFHMAKVDDLLSDDP